VFELIIVVFHNRPFLCRTLYYSRVESGKGECFSNVLLWGWKLPCDFLSEGYWPRLCVTDD